MMSGWSLFPSRSMSLNAAFSMYCPCFLMTCHTGEHAVNAFGTALP